jgi:sporulation-control protein spo0M
MIRGKMQPQTRISRIVRTHHCDFCGVDVDDQKRGWEVNEATIELLEGDVFPEGDQRDRSTVDVCAKCFRSKVMPAIEALGVKFRKRDADDFEHVDEMSP